MLVFNILIGQFLALIGIANAYISTVIEKNYKMVIPLLLTSSYYILLALIWFLISKKFKKPKWYYILITFFDSQANFLNIYAFSIIHFSYPFIINVSSVFWTFLFTYFFIHKYKYKTTHIVGVVISFLGVGISLYGTITFNEKDKFWDNIKGLVCCLISSIFYSM
jgi:drug/metabolite transporter (DMT)-like permease